MITPDLTSPFTGKHAGDVEIHGGEFTLEGTITGNVYVKDATFVMGKKAKVKGNVEMLGGAKVDCHGEITGSLSGNGRVNVNGNVRGGVSIKTG